MASIKHLSLFSVVFLGVIVYCNAAESKYSAFRNTKAEDIKSDKPFRSAKVNLVWEKARKRLSKDQLADIYHDLKFYDQVSMDFKRKKAEDPMFDDKGEQEAIMRKTLMDVLKKHGISDTHPDPMAGNDIMDEAVKTAGTDGDKDWEVIMKDKKLSELWKVASNSGFNKVELDSLRVEFLHHQQKVSEYTELKNEIDQLSANDIHENSIHRFQGTKDQLKEGKQKKGALKEKHFDLKESYDRLANQISGAASDESMSSLGLTDHRVIELWLMMKNSNLSEPELQSFKQELKHFEHKLTKREHFVKEADVAKENFKTVMGKSNDIKQAKLDHLEQKVGDYDKKIKKFHTELKDRVMQAVNHSEL